MMRLVVPSLYAKRKSTNSLPKKGKRFVASELHPARPMPLNGPFKAWQMIPVSRSGEARHPQRISPITTSSHSQPSRLPRPSFGHLTLVPSRHLMNALLGRGSVITSTIRSFVVTMIVNIRIFVWPSLLDFVKMIVLWQALLPHHQKL